MSYDKTKIRPGMTVRSIDGEKLGTIAQVGDQEFIIEKGWLFKEDHRALCDRIVEIRGDEVIYRRLDQEEPAARAEAPKGEAAMPATATTETSAAGEEVRVPLAEEQLVVDKEAREREAARIHKEVVTEEQQVTVPVRHEEVVVEREPMAERAAGTEAFKEQEIGVSAMEEEAHISKRPVVREEVRVRKEPVVEQRVATEELRREEAHVEEAEPERLRRGEQAEPGKRAPGLEEEKKT